MGSCEEDLREVVTQVFRFSNTGQQRLRCSVQFTNPKKLLEGGIGNAHVLNRIQHSNAIRESALNFCDRFHNGVPMILWLQIIGQKNAEMANGFEAR